MRDERIRRLVIFSSQMLLAIRKMKTSLKKRYFNINRILLLIVGIWPYQQSTLVKLQKECVFGVLISFIAFQVQQHF